MRKASRELGTGRQAIIVVAAAMILCGCGSSDTGSDVTHVTKRTGAGANGRPDMVSAVSASKARGPVEVKFAIPHRPEVGQPIEIELAITPSIELERLVARFQASDGLELVSGAETGRLDRPAIGAVISHTVTVIPKADGIYAVTAVIVTDSPTDSVARNFSIPLIAGAGISEPAPAAPTASRNAPSGSAQP